MSGDAFALDPRLDADTHPVISLPLCDVRLMDDARYGWLVLVPRIHGMSEVAELAEDDQITLWQEVNRAAVALRTTVHCEKINLGALGNIVRQLHVHVVARNPGDAAWPGPVWGQGKAVAYDAADRAALASQIREALAI